MKEVGKIWCPFSDKLLCLVAWLLGGMGGKYPHFRQDGARDLYKIDAKILRVGSKFSEK